MLFNSLQFLVFFPIVTLVYFIIPRKAKHLWLLAASYYFYMCWNARYALLILTSTVVTYLSGLLMERVGGGPSAGGGPTAGGGPSAGSGPTAGGGSSGAARKWIVAGSFIINLGILFFFKYFNFAMRCTYSSTRRPSTCCCRWASPSIPSRR